MKNIKLAEIPVSKTFKIDKYEFVVLEQKDGKTISILKDLLSERQKFGKSNNYQNSYVDGICNDFGNIIGNLIGHDNLIEHTVDLTSNDGLKDYGVIQRKMSLLTADLYRKHVEILDKHKINKWWWLATADSTPTHEDSLWVTCVSPRGIIYYYGHYYDDIGVRPFCIFNSNIFVSE